MTMNDHWGYNKADHNYKSVKVLIHDLVDTRDVAAASGSPSSPAPPPGLTTDTSQAQSKRNWLTNFLRRRLVTHSLAPQAVAVDAGTFASSILVTLPIKTSSR